MTLPRATIADVMALTVLVAADCMVLRDGLSENGDVRLALFFFGGLPLLNILMIGLVLLVRRRGRGEPYAFLAGFEAFGGAVLLAHLGSIALFPDEGGAVLNRVCEPFNPIAEKVFPLGLVAGIAIVMAIATLPLLALAVLGGLLHLRYRVVIERRRPVVNVAQ